MAADPRHRGGDDIPDRDPPRRPRLAILSYSSGEFDARSFRLARSAIAAGYHVTMYTRWHQGQPRVEEHDGFRLIRAEFNPRLALPLVGGWARRRAAARIASTAGRDRVRVPVEGDREPPEGVDTGAEPAEGGTGGSRLRSLLLLPVRLVLRWMRRWGRLVVMFPLRPMGWSVALEDAVEPADIWHGMWAGSLPALRRLSRRYGGRTIYDSRDVYMMSRDFERLRWPVRDILAALERRWAKGVDRVLTVNEPYAELISRQLGVLRPPVVMNCPERWTPPVPVPDLIREATGVSPDTCVALYQGRFTTDRGIEQAMDAILEVPGAVLALLGFGDTEARLRELAQTPPYVGRVFVLPAVPPSDLLAWTASADVMVMAIQPTTMNHRFTTPQKLWEAIAAGVPVVASDLPGMAGVVEPAGVGVLCDPTRPASIAAAIRRVLVRPPEERAAHRAHVLQVAHERYNWESQLGTLLAVYAELGHPPTRWPEPETRPVLATAEPDRPAGGPRLRFSPGYVPRSDAEAVDTTLIVLDTAWVPTAEEAATGPVLLRDLVEEVMRERDLIADAAVALDDWAEASGIAGLMVHEGVSFWYGARQGHWSWLLDRILWLAVVDRLLARYPGTRVLSFDAGADDALVAAGREIAQRDGLVVEGDATRTSAILPARATPRATPRPDAKAVAIAGGSGRRRRFPLRSLLGRLRRRVRPSAMDRRRREVLRRVNGLGRERARRLLVVQAHVRQRVVTPAGPRLLNVYLGPVADRLRGTRLDPFEVDIRSTLADDTAWALLAGRDRVSRRSLPGDALNLIAPPVTPGTGKEEAARMAARVAEVTVPVMVSGVDLGPSLATRVSRMAIKMAARIDDVAHIRALLIRLHPAGILIADEYHRQDWLAAAAAERVPVVAVQHGVIYRWHAGYIHRARPPELRLPARTFVFGRWERDLLTGVSVYAPHEVGVGGSPRLDLVRPEEVNPVAVRRELGVADGDRVVILSGTWGRMYRRFHYPIVLGRLFARPTERLHLVVKLHPSEHDEGPYRRIVEGLAAAGGFAPPPITVVRDVDLYRLLAAADAHLGIHSTVLTEAVATGTPNLLATGLRGADLLGYVEAGVAIPVETPEDLAAALERPRSEAMSPDHQRAFLELHYEPGSASARIAASLLELLP